MIRLILRHALTFSLIALLWTTAWTVCAEQSTVEQDQQLAGTIRRYFAGMAGYHEGNLICQSQVEELQRYLRRTQGNIPAVQMLLLKRVLSDEAPLVRFFYTENGETVLGTVASKLAGYTELEAAARTAEGRIQIKKAITANQPDVLLEFLRQEFTVNRRSNSSGSQATKGQLETKSADHRIYTLDQFIEAALANPISEPGTSTG